MSAETPGAVGRFLTIADAAEILNVEPGDVLALVQSGELPAIRISSSGQWRIERVTLESYIEAMYEEARRRSLWEQSDFGNIPELSGGSILRPQPDRGRETDGDRPDPSWNRPDRS